MTKKHTVIVDQIGRNVVGVEKARTDTTITLGNPVILHFQPAQSGQLELQVFPLFFFELLDKEKRENNDWTYDISAITVSNVELNDEILSRYEAINTPKEDTPKVEESKIVSIDDL